MFAASKTAAPASAPVYIEDVMSTFLYTGNGSTQTITNGIDLSGKGGLTWIKFRNPAADGITGEHCLFDTARGATYRLRTNATNPQGAVSNSLTSFNSDGFSLGAFDQVNSGYLSRQTYASWTFRKQPKFFDVVTYTGNGASARAISHNLGSVPGCMIVKRTDSTSDWRVYHRGCSTDNGVLLNDTSAQTTSAVYWFGNGTNVIPPTSTQFTVNDIFTNTNGGTYVAYLFAHDAGGFGLTGTDNVISCGSWTGAGSDINVNLGYEPQWLLIKRTDDVQDWYIVDNMRGLTVKGSTDAYLYPNGSYAEGTTTTGPFPNATGFGVSSSFVTAGRTYIYIAIRRGPMKTPTSGTSVFSPNTSAALSGTISTGFPVDLSINSGRVGTNDHYAMDRLRGDSTNYYNYLVTDTTAAEASGTGAGLGFDNNTGFVNNWSSASYVWWNFRRAPGFFDEVCYSGTSVANTLINHNLGVVPEMIIIKRRNLTRNWCVYSNALTLPNSLRLNTTDAAGSYSEDLYSTPTSTQFALANNSATNSSTGTYVAYLFATCAGVSKVGSYTGTGTTNQIDCGFTGGARFVLIKRTDSTGDWYVWDSARGIVAGNDPYLLLNSTAAEVTNTDYVDTYNAGFEISSTAPAAINANGGTFIFLAIA